MGKSDLSDSEHCMFIVKRWADPSISEQNITVTTNDTQYNRCMQKSISKCKTPETLKQMG